MLYRALQLQRGLDLDAIQENIAAEARRGREQMRELARSRARDARSAGAGVDAVGAMDGEGFDDGIVGGGVLVGVRRKRVLGGKELCEGMEEAVGDLRAEVEGLEEEVRLLVEECEGIVDELGGLEMGEFGVRFDVRALREDLLAVQARAEERIVDGRAKIR